MNSKSELRRMAVQQPLDVAEKLAAAQKALAAADRLAEMIESLIVEWDIEADHTATPHSVSTCPLCSTIESRTAYLAERGRS